MIVDDAERRQKLKAYLAGIPPYQRPEPKDEDAKEYNESMRKIFGGIK